MRRSLRLFFARLLDDHPWHAATVDARVCSGRPDPEPETRRRAHEQRVAALHVAAGRRPELFHSVRSTPPYGVPIVVDLSK